MENDKNLIEALAQWAKDNDVARISGDKNYWQRNEVAKIVRGWVQKIGRWKAAKRGNPSAGYSKMRCKNSEW